MLIFSIIIFILFIIIIILSINIVTQNFNNNKTSIGNNHFNVIEDDDLEYSQQRLEYNGTATYYSTEGKQKMKFID